MPGLSQLQKFNSDILSLGNEPTLRAQRGEQALSVPLPKGVKDIDDSDDFVVGMPIVLNNVQEQKKIETVDDEDFSDITGEKSDSSNDSNKQEASSEKIPDFSDLLTPNIDQADNQDIPDLSMFMDPVETSVPEEVEEPEPEEPAIADLNLEDLLNTAGFDSENEFPADSDDQIDELTPIEEISAVEDDLPVDEVSLNDDINPVTEQNYAESAEAPLEDFGSSLEDLEPLAESAETPLEDFGSSLEDLEPLAESTETPLEDFGSSLEDLEPIAESAETPLEDFGSALEDLEPLAESAETPLEDFGSTLEDLEPLAESTETSLDDFDELESIPTMPDESISEDFAITDEVGTLDDISGDNFEENFDIDSLTEDDFVINNSFDDTSASLDSLPNFDVEETVPSESLTIDESLPADDTSDLDDLSTLDDLDGLNDLDNVDNLDNLDNFDNADNLDSLDNLDNLDSFDNADNLDNLDEDVSLNNSDDSDELGEIPSGLFDSNDMELPKMDDDSLDDLSLPEDSFASDTTDFSEDFPSDFNFNLDEGADDNQDISFDADAPIEQFDTSQMDDLDFGIPDTDSQLDANGDFELGNSSDFGTDNGEFEIPGFSDVETVATSKDGKIKRPVTAAEQNEINQKNSLTDEQYEKFLKNLASYPLNVRIAVEELIVKNEFTDEAEFDIVQKVLKKISARQLASELERMLDISILVPRDFERRTAEEYEAYKASFQYQLRNKIIPGAILGIFASFLCFVLVIFTKNYIYNPLKASSLYRQGYALIENDEFVQSEIEFNKAAKYKLIKKWFYKYADAYRTKKQYLRAEQMYKATLRFFNQDKLAGIKYAEMELYDLANYEKAEEITLREILDHHINDSDGLLLLGDVYLEWATEKDPTKFEEAKTRYAELIQLYGETDLYMSRMMRYFIRTENLLRVLELKERFMPKEKSLNAQDWTELSGFLLDKLYGTLPASEEYLRNKIEDVKELLVRAVKADEKNPTALYNLSRYYVNMKNNMKAKSTLEHAINAFNNLDVVKKKDVYNQIDSYRLLGEEYIREKEYLKAQEVLTQGISNYISAHELSGLKGTEKIGKLYTDMGDINYFITGDLDNALQNYKDSIETFYDTPQIRYKIGYIQYGKKNYSEALGSFMKSSELYADDPNLLLAMGNTLSLRNDNFAAQGYYDQLLEFLDNKRVQKGLLFPQVRSDEAQIVDMYLKASNNLGVTMFRLAKRTGNSNLNAKAIVHFQESMRAWDSMTRNQQSMVRLGGSNLAEQNIQYVTHPVPNFEPAIYTDIPRTLNNEKGLTE
jgi:tetratricopeptide (TPR) repeat protein